MDRETETWWAVLSKNREFLGFRWGSRKWSFYDSVATGGYSNFTEPVGYWATATDGKEFELIGKELKKIEGGET